jgi:biopolymer transport protein ExbB
MPGPGSPQTDRLSPSRIAWLVPVLACAVLLSVTPASRVRAQDAAKEKAPAAAKADDPVKADEAAPAAAKNGAEGAAPPKPKSMLKWFLDAAGPIGVFLLLISVYMVQLVVRLFMELRVGEAVPPTLVDRIDTAIRERKFQEAYDACRDNESFLARLVRTGVANLPNGRPEAKEAMNSTSEEIVTGMEQRIGYLAIIGQLGPLIGLVGTIIGMIMSFQEIALAAGAQPKPEKVAEGISTALVITLLGISLSVPAIFFFALFRNRVAVMTMEATRAADRVINSLVAAAKAAKGT